MLYLSGQLPSPITPADARKVRPPFRQHAGAGREHVQQDTEPAEGAGARHGRHRDDARLHGGRSGDGQDRFAGMNAAYAKFFGTRGAAEQAREVNGAGRGARGGRRAARGRSAGGAQQMRLATLLVVGACTAALGAETETPSTRVFTEQQAEAGRTAYAKTAPRATCQT